MPRSESSSGSRRSGRSSRSSRSSKSNSSVSSKSYDVDLPQKSLRMDCILYFSGANPRKMRHLRREEFVETYDVSYHGTMREEERTWSKWYFVGVPDDYDYEYFSGDEDDRSPDRSMDRSSSSKRSSHRRRGSRGSKNRLWAKRKSRKGSDSSDSESESESDDGSDYGYDGPQPQMFQGHPPPPHPMPRGPPPQRQGNDAEMPAFFTVRQQ